MGIGLLTERETGTFFNANMTVQAPHGRLEGLWGATNDWFRVVRMQHTVQKPNDGLQFRPKMKVVGKAQAPGADEIASNARARSARLRVAERL